MSDPLMKLPKNKTCADCRHSGRCCSMYGAKPENRYCDFYPVRFVGRKPEGK